MKYLYADSTLKLFRDYINYYQSDEITFNFQQ